MSTARGLVAASALMSLLCAAPLPARGSLPAGAGSAHIQTTLITGVLGPKTSVRDDASAESVARRTLAAHFPAIHAITGSALTNAAVTQRGDGSWLVSFEQQVSGIAVEGRGARVLVDADGTPSIASAVLDDRTPTALGPTLDDKDAASRASRGGGFAYSPIGARLALVPTATALRLAWIVRAPVPASLGVRPIAIVDATTGKVLQRGDLVRRAKQVNAFTPNPRKSPLVKVTIPTLADGATTLVTPKWIAQSCVDKKTVRNVEGFGGTIAMHVCEPAHAAEVDAAGDFLAPRPASDSAADDLLSETSIAYHVDRAFTWFGSIGLASLRPQSVPLRVVANVRMPPSYEEGPRSALGCATCALQPFDNAFYSPAPDSFGKALWGIETDALFFGQGQTTDYAYDGDVVYHELGHAVIDTTSKLGFGNHLDEDGASPVSGSIHEGLADYFASAITGDGQVGEYAGGQSPIRDLDEVHGCPDRFAGESHHDSLPLSGALWQARKTLPEASRSKLDRAVLLALQILATNDPSWDVMVSSLRAAIGKEAPEAAAAFEAAIVQRGMGKCRRIRELPEGGVASSGFGYFAVPADYIAADLEGGIAPGVVQLHRTLPPGTGRIIVRFDGQELPASPRWLPSPPWTPMLLVKFGGSIVWSDSGGTWSGDHTVARDLGEGGGGFEETVSVPDGARDVYVMIATVGQGTGLYDNVDVEAIAGPAQPDAGPVDAAPGDAGADAGPKADGGFTPTSDLDDRDILNGRACACRVPAGARSEGSASTLSALAGLLVAIRGRRVARSRRQ